MSEWRDDLKIETAGMSSRDNDRKCPNDWHDSAPARATQKCPECLSCRFCDEQARFLVEEPILTLGACQSHLRRVIEAVLIDFGSGSAEVTKIDRER